MDRVGGVRTHVLLSAPQPPERLTRRRFLLSIGLLVGAGAIAPLASRFRAGDLARVESSRAGLGTWIRIVARHRDAGRAGHAIEQAYAAIDRVDRQMSIHRADSEVARVNAAAGRRAVPVSAATLEVVDRARTHALASGGVYDPTILPLMRTYGFYGAQREHLPTDAEVAAALACVGARHIEVDRAAGTIGLARAGMALDLGSIGKGWAVDQAVAALRAEGIESGLVDVGRNVYGLGTADDEAAAWSVGVLHPVTGQVDHVFALHNSAVATSGNSEQSHLLDGVAVGHLLDAHLGRPARTCASVSVQAGSGTDSDVGSTLAFVLGRDGTGLLPGALATHWIG